MREMIPMSEDIKRILLPFKCPFCHNAFGLDVDAPGVDLAKPHYHLNKRTVCCPYCANLIYYPEEKDENMET